MCQAFIEHLLCTKSCTGAPDIQGPEGACAHINDLQALRSGGLPTTVSSLFYPSTQNSHRAFSFARCICPVVSSYLHSTPTKWGGQRLLHLKDGNTEGQESEVTWMRAASLLPVRVSIKFRPPSSQDQWPVPHTTQTRTTES